MVIPAPPDTPPPVVVDAPSASSGLTRRLRTTVVLIVLIALVIIGIIGYAIGGYAYATARVASTDRTLNNVILRESVLNTAYMNINNEFGVLGSSKPFNSVQATSVTDELVASATQAGVTVNQDDESLAAASTALNDRRWLTVFSQNLLEKEAGRVAHARKALADARTIAADYVLDGQFLQAFLIASGDLNSLAAETSSSDLTAASATVTTMKTDVDKALMLSTAPGLPAALNALMNDFETLVADFGKLIVAAKSNHDAGVAAAATTVQSDADKISAYDYDKISTDIQAYYRPLVADFNSQMAAATP